MTLVACRLPDADADLSGSCWNAPCAASTSRPISALIVADSKQGLFARARLGRSRKNRSRFFATMPTLQSLLDHLAADEVPSLRN